MNESILVTNMVLRTWLRTLNEGVFPAAQGAHLHP